VIEFKKNITDKIRQEIVKIRRCRWIDAFISVLSEEKKDGS